MAEMLDTLDHCAAPVIAWVHGVAAGRLSATDARAGLTPECGSGLRPTGA